MSVRETLRDMPWGEIGPYEEAFAREGERIAAVSVACSYGDADRGHAFYPALRDLTQRYGALLIFDEIVMGFRLARAGAQEYFGVTPDLAVFAKGISNGVPLSCYLGRREVMETVRRATISSTFGGDTLGLAAARAAIDTYRREDVIGRLWERGRQLQDGLNRLFREQEAPAAVTGPPPCCQVGFTTPDRERNAALFLQFEGELLRRGVIIYSVMYVNFSHTREEIDAVLERMADSLRAMHACGYRGEA